MAALLLALPGPGAAEEIRLFPDGPKNFGMRNFFAPFSVFFVGPGHFYGQRRLRVETTPPDAIVDLFYVRAGFQKRFEQVEAPITVILPKRINANPKDVVIVRAFVEGYRVQETTVKVTSRTDEVHLEMEALPNVLRAVSHTYFGGRASLAFLTEEALTMRVQDRDDGFAVALNETAKGEGVDAQLAGLGGPLVGDLQAHQLGEDLLIQVKWGPAAAGAAPELRSRSGRDGIRDLHVYVLDLIGPEAGADAVMRTRAALARITTGDVTGCAGAFDRGLRESLDAAQLARALTPQGRFTDPYLRAAMRRLGEVWPGGGVELADGTRFATSVPLQLHAAQDQAASVQGYLALLRRLVVLLEEPDERRAVLGGLIAPEVGTAEFARAMDAAEGAERTCLAGR